MCGVVAIYDLQGRQVEESDIQQMASILRHRGPDEAGYAILNGRTLGLGHVRLSIIDLQTGQQPMYNENGNICLIYNGEIYDYRELRRSLEKQGHRFHSTSDSEVIIHLYEQYGPEFLKRMNGEFAFILWDQEKKRLLAARDRAGVKPLYYMEHDAEFIFASEAKAILTLPRVKRSISKEYLVGPLIGFFSPVACAFEGIHSLKPGHFLLIENGIPREERPYWEFRFNLDYSMTRNEAREEIKDLFVKAVERRMVADVEVGNYLSGGIDSTLVCAVMAMKNQSMRSFNIGFGGSEYDETDVAKRVAAHYGVRFETINCSMADMSERYEKTVYHTELALSNPSSIGKFMLSGFVRDCGIKVCLTGEGADEVFGGYAYFKLEKLWRMMTDPDAEVRREAKELYSRFRKLERRSKGLLWDTDMDWKKKDHVLGYPCYLQLRTEAVKKTAKSLYRWDLLGLTEQDSPDAAFVRVFEPARLSTLDPFNASRILAFGQLSSYIIPTLGDRVEMGNSVECRTPFLDREILDFSTRIPPDYFMDIGSLREKALLREAFQDITPDFLRKEHKHPFLSPNWLRFSKTTRGAELFNEFTSPDRLRKTGIFNPSFCTMIKRFWKYLPGHSSQQKRFDIFAGSLLGTQMLHYLFIENRPAGDVAYLMQDRSPEKLKFDDGSRSCRACICAT